MKKSDRIRRAIVGLCYLALFSGALVWIQLTHVLPLHMDPEAVFRYSGFVYGTQTTIFGAIVENLAMMLVNFGCLMLNGVLCSVVLVGVPLCVTAGVSSMVFQQHLLHREVFASAPAGNDE